MNKLGKLIYTTDFDYKVYALTMRDKSSSRVSVEIYIVNPQGEMSDIITIPRKDIYTKKTVFHLFYDFEGDFDKDDISQIACAILGVIRDESQGVVTQSKATVTELHEAVSEYIRVNAEELEDNPQADIFIKDGYGFMCTDCINAFLKEHKELGYSKRVEVLKRLKIMGALINGTSRPYDISVSVGGEKKHVYKILLADSVSETVEEVIEI